MKYLQNSGTLDKMKEKVEQRQSETAPEVEVESSPDILKEIDRKTDNGGRSDQDDVIAEQQRKIEELERKNRELQNQRESSTTSNLPPLNTPAPPPPPSTSNDGAPSLDDLVREAENNIRNKGNNPNLGGSQSDSPSLGNSNKSIATWSFSFNNINGTIELFQEGNKLVTRTVYTSSNRVDVQELYEQNERLYVRDSPTGEYYTLRSNGDLDAYDNSGFLTTCRRR